MARVIKERTGTVTAVWENVRCSSTREKYLKKEHIKLSSRNFNRTYGIPIV